MSQKRKYKQYFTPNRLAEYMVNIVPDASVCSVVDL